MPELPEVEAARASIQEHFAGQRIVEVQAFQDDKVMEGVNAEELEGTLKGRVLMRVCRKGKHLWFMMDGDPLPCPIFHLGMAGAFEIRGAQVVKYKRALNTGEDWPPRWCKVALEFENGGALAFIDSRRFGKIRVSPSPESSPPISDLGPDALNELPEGEHLAALFMKSQRAIKAVLLDQAVLSGLGNWLADEVLYQARIHPESKGSSLGKEECLRLHSTIQSVLSLSVKVNADSAQFPDTWLFHKRWNKVPGSLGGHKLSFITVSGRTSAIVPALQKLAPGSTLGASTSDRGKGGRTRRLNGRKKGSEEEDEEEEKSKARKKRRELSVKPKTNRKRKRKDESDSEVEESEGEEEVEEKEGSTGKRSLEPKRGGKGRKDKEMETTSTGRAIAQTDGVRKGRGRKRRRVSEGEEREEDATCHLETPHTEDGDSEGGEVKALEREGRMKNEGASTTGKRRTRVQRREKTQNGGGKEETQEGEKGKTSRRGKKGEEEKGKSAGEEGRIREGHGEEMESRRVSQRLRSRAHNQILTVDGVKSANGYVIKEETERNDWQTK